MHSSTCKTHVTERRLHDIGDTSFLNIRLDSLDLERATATLDAGRSADRSAQLPYQGLGIFRINLTPRFQLPKMPRAAVFRSKTERTPEYAGQTSPAPIVPLYHPRRTGPVSSWTRSSADKHNENRRSGGDTALRSRASDVSGPTTIGPPSLRLSDYGRGLVSIKRDFASSSQELDPWFPSQ